jgi:hypothetical protein
MRSREWRLGMNEWTGSARRPLGKRKAREENAGVDELDKETDTNEISKCSRDLLYFTLLTFSSVALRRSTAPW